MVPGANASRSANTASTMSGAGEAAVGFDRDDAAGPCGQLARQRALPRADLQRGVRRRQAGRVRNAAEEAGIEEEVLAEAGAH